MSALTTELPNAGLRGIIAVQYATVAILPACTYANGTAGVGATLTGNSNGAAAAIDGQTPALGDIALIDTQAAGLQCGVYKLTQVGTGGTPFIWTRAVTCDTAAKIAGCRVRVVGGTDKAGTEWSIDAKASAITVGTTALVFSACPFRATRCVQSGLYASARGFISTASGNVSDARGSSTVASGVQSCTSGDSTQAFGIAATADGYFCRGLGDYSHAEGYQSDSFGHQCHAEGRLCQTWGPGGHSEGSSTTSTGQGAHSEGRGTRAGMVPLAFTIPAGGTLVTIAGNVTGFFTNGDECKVNRTTPTQLASIVSGVGSVPAFAAGNTTFNIPTPLDSTTTGGFIVNIVYAQGAHAEGFLSTATAGAAHAEGDTCTASGGGSHAQGHNTIASGNYSHAQGDGTLASGDQSNACGIACTASGVNSSAGGNTSTATAAASWSYGQTCHATGINSHATGSATTASGLNSHAEGASTTAGPGEEAHAEGLSTTASGNASHAEGYSNTASGALSHAGGQATTASGEGAFTHGFQCTAAGDYALAIGNGASAPRASDFARAGGRFGANGDAQTRYVVMKGTTPGSGAGESVALTYVGPNTVDSLKRYKVTVEAIACQMATTTSAAVTACWHFTFTVGVRSGGTVDISAVTVIAAPIVTGAAFVGATLVPSSSGANNLTLTMTLAGGITANTRTVADVKFMELVGT